MSNERFYDFIGDITLTGSVVRIDLMTLSTVERDAEGKPKPMLAQTLVMPVEGFVRSHEMMLRMIDALVKNGTLQRNAPVAFEVAKPTQTAAPEAIRSPNFPTTN